MTGRVAENGAEARRSAIALRRNFPHIGQTDVARRARQPTHSNSCDAIEFVAGRLRYPPDVSVSTNAGVWVSMEPPCREGTAIDGVNGMGWR